MSLVEALFLSAISAALIAIAVLSVAVIRNSLGGELEAADPAGIARALRTAGAGGSGRIAFVAHRISGYAVLAFLVVHLLDVSTYAFSPALYDSLHPIYGTTPMRILESALWGGLVFHSLNGLRLIAVDALAAGHRSSRRALGAVSILSLVVWVAGSIAILGPAL